MTVSVGREKRLTLVVAFLVLGAVIAVRGLYLASLARSPLSDWHRWMETDEYAYLAWSEHLAAGNWLDAPAFRSWGAWQERFAPPAVWESWYQKNVYFQGVAYPYFVALVRKAVGFPVSAVRLLHLLLAAGTAAAVALAVRAVALRTGSAERGLAAGPLAAGLAYGLFGPLVFHDGFVLRDGPVTHVSTLLLIAPLLVASPGPWLALGLGLFGGAATLLKQTLLPIALLSLALLCRRARPGRRAVVLGAAAAGLLAPLLLLFARNVAVGAPTFAFDTRTQVCLPWACARGANGTNTPSPLMGEILRQAGGSTGKLVKLVAESWRDAPWGFAALELKKLATFFNEYEIPDNANFYFFRDHLDLLVFLPVFACLFGPGVVGLAAACQARLLSRGEGLLLLSGILLPLASCLLVSTTSRYRVAVAGPLAVGLGLGISLAVARAARDGVRRVAPAVLLALLVSFVPLLPSPIPAPRLLSSDALVAATLTEARVSGAAGAVEIGRYLRDGTDDPWRQIGIAQARLWLSGERRQMRIAPESIAPPEKRFRLRPR